MKIFMKTLHLYSSCTVAFNSSLRQPYKFELSKLFNFLLIFFDLCNIHLQQQPWTITKIYLNIFPSYHLRPLLRFLNSHPFNHMTIFALPKCNNCFQSSTLENTTVHPFSDKSAILSPLLPVIFGNLSPVELFEHLIRGISLLVPGHFGLPVCSQSPWKSPVIKNLMSACLQTWLLVCNNAKWQTKLIKWRLKKDGFLQFDKHITLL